MLSNISQAVCGLLFRQEEQTFPTGSHVPMPTRVKFTQTCIKANQVDTPVSAGLSLEPMVDCLSLSPSRVQTDSVLPQSCKTCLIVLCFFSYIEGLVQVSGEIQSFLQQQMCELIIFSPYYYTFTQETFWAGCLCIRLMKCEMQLGFCCCFFTTRTEFVLSLYFKRQI